MAIINTIFDFSESNLVILVSIANILVGISTIVLLIYTGRQFNISEKTYSAQLLIPISTEYKDKKWIEIRKLLKRPNLEIDIEKFESSGIPEIIHFFNHVGYLLNYKYVDIQGVYEILGIDIQIYWPKIKEYIYYRRTNSEEFFPYQYHAQYLFIRCLCYSKSKNVKIEKKIRKMENIEEKLI